MLRDQRTNRKFIDTESVWPKYGGQILDARMPLKRRSARKRKTNRKQRKKITHKPKLTIRSNRMITPTTTTNYNYKNERMQSGSSLYLAENDLIQNFVSK